MPANLKAERSVLIHHLAKSGCIKSMKTFLSLFPSRKDQITLLNLREESGFLPFGCAASGNHIEMVKVRYAPLFLCLYKENNVKKYSFSVPLKEWTHGPLRIITKWHPSPFAQLAGTWRLCKLCLELWKKRKGEGRSWIDPTGEGAQLLRELLIEQEFPCLRFVDALICFGFCVLCTYLNRIHSGFYNWKNWIYIGKRAKAKLLCLRLAMERGILWELWNWF